MGGLRYIGLIEYGRSVGSFIHFFVYCIFLYATLKVYEVVFMKLIANEAFTRKHNRIFDQKHNLCCVVESTS